jgi:hypothetical protein
VTEYKKEYGASPPGNDLPRPWGDDVDYRNRPWTDPK